MGYREMPATAGFGFRTHTWRNGEIIQGRIRNVRKSANTFRIWRKWPQNQAAQIDGQSRRIFRKSRAIRAIAWFGFRPHTRRIGIRRGGIRTGRNRRRNPPMWKSPGVRIGRMRIGRIRWGVLADVGSADGGFAGPSAEGGLAAFHVRSFISITDVMIALRTSCKPKESVRTFYTFGRKLLCDGCENSRITQSQTAP